MALPNLVIAGVTKAGTTSLFHYLGQHPEIGVADLKEVRPLRTAGARCRAAVAGRVRAAHFAQCADSPWRLEASPRYLHRRARPWSGVSPPTSTAPGC